MGSREALPRSGVSPKGAGSSVEKFSVPGEEWKASLLRRGGCGAAHALYCGQPRTWERQSSSGVKTADGFENDLPGSLWTNWGPVISQEAAAKGQARAVAMGMEARPGEEGGGGGGGRGGKGEKRRWGKGYGGGGRRRGRGGRGGKGGGGGGRGGKGRGGPREEEVEEEVKEEGSTQGCGLGRELAELCEGLIHEEDPVNREDP